MSHVLPRFKTFLYMYFYFYKAFNMLLDCLSMFNPLHDIFDHRCQLFLFHAVTLRLALLSLLELLHIC